MVRSSFPALWKAALLGGTVQSECQPLFDKILSLTFGKVIKSGSAESKAAWERAADITVSWLDNVDLSGRPMASISAKEVKHKKHEDGIRARSRGL